VRRHGGTLLCDTIARDFEEKESSLLIGLAIETPSDLALVSEIYRNPIFETLRYLFVDHSQRVVSETAVSSRLPSSSVMHPNFTDDVDMSAWLADRGTPYGATGIWLLHNHPSGDPTPSRADLELTKRLHHELMRDGRIALHGHVVINHTRFAFINNCGDYEIDTIRSGPDPLVHHVGISVISAVTSPNSAATVARQIFHSQNENSVALITLDARSKVTVATSIDLRSLLTPRSAGLAIMQAKRGRGCLQFVVVDRQNYESVEKSLTAARKSGLITDVVFRHPDKSYTSLLADNTSLGLEGKYLASVFGRNGRSNRGFER